MWGLRSLAAVVLFSAWHGSCFREGILGTDNAEELRSRRHQAAGGRKTVTFFRHGQSVGNALAKGDVGTAMKALVKGRSAVADGHLTSKGEKQAVERASTMSALGLEAVNSAEVVLVSPLSRAMATALIVLATARCRAVDCQAGPVEWPRIEVVSELREKVASMSDEPGTGLDAMAYVRKIAATYSEKHFGNEEAMESLVAGIAESYEQEGERTARWKDLELKDGVAYAGMIEAFKKKLASRPERNLLLVAHSGWARFAFAPLLPGPPLAPEEAQQRLFEGGRWVHPLANVGMLRASFDTSFRDAQVDEPEDEDAPPNLGSELKWGFFTSAAQAKAAGTVPRDARCDRLVVEKRMEGAMGMFTNWWKSRILTFAATDGVASLAWSDHWGVPRNQLLLSGGNATMEKIGNCTYTITDKRPDPVHRPFDVRLPDESSAAELEALFKDYGAA